MHYVKLFNINGVDTKQVACIELQGPPNAATEGAVGVLGMDMTSPTHEVYRCVAVTGSVYTWELLSAGLSIVSATITREGAITTWFPYTSLKIPTSYLIKVGDLILDTEGYLYQVSSISGNSCFVEYSGTHLGGAGASDKDCNLVVQNGKLQLVTDSGNVVSEVDFMLPDENTIYRDPSDGKAFVMAMKTVNDGVIRIFVGTQAAYDALSDEKKGEDLFALITDDDSADVLDDVVAEVESLKANLENSQFTASQIKVGEPQYNGDKQLTESGYYHIRAWAYEETSGVYDFGVVYHEKNQKTIHPCGKKTLEISTGGQLSLYEEGVSSTEFAGWVFATAKIGD